MEAEKLIAAKARNMLRHYVETVLPEGFKSQLVAHSRRATLRYRDALISARDELVAQIERLPEATRSADLEGLDLRTAFLVRAATAPGPAAGDRLRAGHLGRDRKRRGTLRRPGPTRTSRRSLIDSDFLKPFPVGTSWPREGASRIPHRQVDAVDRVRRPGRAGAVPGPVDARGGTAAGRRPGEPARRRQEVRLCDRLRRRHQPSHPGAEGVLPRMSRAL